MLFFSLVVYFQIFSTAVVLLILLQTFAEARPGNSKYVKYVNVCVNRHLTFDAQHSSCRRELYTQQKNVVAACKCRLTQNPTQNNNRLMR